MFAFYDWALTRSPHWFFHRWSWLHVRLKWLIYGKPTIPPPRLRLRNGSEISGWVHPADPLHGESDDWIWRP